MEANTMTGAASAIDESSHFPKVGEVIDHKYQIVTYIGMGGMAAVARATHLIRKAPVALKFMSAEVAKNPGAVDRFVNEAVAASQIDTEHVVKVFDVCRLADGTPYLVMELLDGIDLAGVVARDGGLPVSRAIHLVLQVLRALNVAHASGVVHRDVKPSNCFVVEREGDPDFVKLLDFGISKSVQQNELSLTGTHMTLGTPLYMSPEQAHSPKNVDARSDLYSVGVILYELLAGHPPFGSGDVSFSEHLFKLFTCDAPDIRAIRPDVPESLGVILRKSLARDPGARMQSATEFAVALAPYADQRSVGVLMRFVPQAQGPHRAAGVPQQVVVHHQTLAYQSVEVDAATMPPPPGFGSDPAPFSSSGPTSLPYGAPKSMAKPPVAGTNARAREGARPSEPISESKIGLRRPSPSSPALPLFEPPSPRSNRLGLGGDDLRSPVSKRQGPSYAQPNSVPTLAALVTRELARGSSDLPNLPKLVREVLSLARKSDVDFDHVSRLAEHEPALASRLLAVSNSAYYSRGGQQLTSIKKALVRIGAQTTRDLLCQTAYANAFQAPAFQSYVDASFNHAVVVAKLARLLTTRVGQDPDHAYLAGLFHDVGRAFCFRLAAMNPKSVPATMEELLEVIDSSHVRVGSQLIERWRLPVEVSEACLHHHSPEGWPLASVVHVADVVAKFIEEEPRATEEELVTAFKLLGIDAVYGKELVRFAANAMKETITGESA